MGHLFPEEQYILYADIYEGRTDKEISFALAGDKKSANKYRLMRQRALKKLGRLFVKHGIRNVPLNI